MRLCFHRNYRNKGKQQKSFEIQFSEILKKIVTRLSQSISILANLFKIQFCIWSIDIIINRLPQNMLFFFCWYIFICGVYFDQQTGAPLAVSWSKSFFFAFNQVFYIFPSLRKKRKESRTKTCTANGVRSLHTLVKIHNTYWDVFL